MTPCANCRKLEAERDAAVEAYRDLRTDSDAALRTITLRAEKAETEVTKIHKSLGRGSGHGSVDATAQCVLDAVFSYKEMIAEIEAELKQVRADGVCTQAEYYKLRAVAKAADSLSRQLKIDTLDDDAEIAAYLDELDDAITALAAGERKEGET